MRVGCWIGALLGVALSGCASGASPSDRCTAIAFAHIGLIDMQAGRVRADMTVEVAGARIVSISAASSAQISFSTEVIDGRGMFLMPGLVDMHVHSDGDVIALQRFVSWGVTGVRDMGGDVETLASTRRRAESADIIAPHLAIAGPALAGPPGQGDDATWIVRTPEEARLAVRRLASLRVDFIKVHDHLSRDAYFAASEEARRRGLPLVGHVSDQITPMEASDFGQRSIEHFEYLPKTCMARFDPAADDASPPSGCNEASIDALLTRLSRNGTWLDPTLNAFRYFAPAQWDTIAARAAQLSQQMRENRVQILAGTDWSRYLESRGAQPGESLHDELAALVRSGFSPAEALRAATLNPARYFGEPNSGTIVVGADADLVLLGANPFQSIANTKTIRAVYRQGRLYDQRALDLLRAADAPVPPAPSRCGPHQGDGTASGVNIPRPLRL